MRRKRSVHSKWYHGYVGRFWILYAASLLIVILFFVAIANNLFGPLPSFKDLENPETNLATEIYSLDGKMIGTYYIENRSNVEFKDLPPDLVNALLATEDIRFAIEDVLLNKDLTAAFPIWLRSGYKFDGDPVVLTVVDQYTFKLAYTAAYGGFLLILAIQEAHCPSFRQG